jgi:hypothetical protein
MRVHLDTMQTKRLEVWLFDAWQTITDEHLTLADVAKRSSSLLGFTVTPWHVSVATQAIGKTWPALTGRRVPAASKPQSEAGADVLAELKAIHATMRSFEATFENIETALELLLEGRRAPATEAGQLGLLDGLKSA